MWSCEQSLVTVAKLSYLDLTRKFAFFEGWPWFKFSNLGLALGTNLKFCASVAKELELKSESFESQILRL